MTDLTEFMITQRWPVRTPGAVQLYSLPTPNGDALCVGDA